MVQALMFCSFWFTPGLGVVTVVPGPELVSSGKYQLSVISHQLSIISHQSSAISYQCFNYQELTGRPERLEGRSTALAETSGPALADVLALRLGHGETGGPGVAALQVRDGLVVGLLVERVGLQSRHQTQLLILSSTVLICHSLTV